jgi:hypothetical protein
MVEGTKYIRKVNIKADIRVGEIEIFSGVVDTVMKLEFSRCEELVRQLSCVTQYVSRHKLYREFELTYLDQ